MACKGKKTKTAKPTILAVINFIIFTQAYKQKKVI